MRSALARKNYTGELEFTFEADADWLDIPYTEFSAPVSAKLYYEIRNEDKVLLEGTVTFALKGLCSRCLSEAERRISYETEGVFSAFPKDVEYGFQNGFVDLREFLRDSVMFALPQRLLCDACAEEE